MPNPNYTHLLFILDRSGSMGERGKDEGAIGGINHFITEQLAQEGECTATLVQFDTQEPYEVVYSMKPINFVEPRNRQNYQPRGGTPLLDCVGAAITTELASIQSMHDADQPGLVIVNILTDGEENSSREWKLEAVKALVQRVEKEHNWQVLFTGAGIDAFAAGQALGVAQGKIAGVGGTAKGMKAAYGASSSFASRARTATSRGVKVDENYSADERGIIDSGN